MSRPQSAVVCTENVRLRRLWRSWAAFALPGDRVPLQWNSTFYTAHKAT